MSVKDPKEIRQKCIGIFLVSSLKSTWLVRREVTKIKPSFHVGRLKTYPQIVENTNKINANSYAFIFNLDRTEYKFLR